MTRCARAACCVALLVACDRERDPTYTDPVDLFEPIAVSNGIVFVEKHRSAVMAFEMPSFAVHRQMLPGVVPSRVMRRAGGSDTVLLLNAASDADAPSVLAIHPPLEPNAGEASSSCAAFERDASPPTESGSDAEASVLDAGAGDAGAGCLEPGQMGGDSGCRDAEAEPTPLECEPAPKGLCSDLAAGSKDPWVRCYRIRGAWDAWWQSPDGHHLLLTGRRGRLPESEKKREVALVSLGDEAGPVCVHPAVSGGQALDQVVFSDTIEARRLVALRENNRVSVLEYAGARVAREFAIAREPSPANPSEFAPVEVEFAYDWLLIRERDSAAILAWRWARDEPSSEVKAVRLDAPATAMTIVHCGNAHWLVVAEPGAEQSGTRLHQFVPGESRSSELQLDLNVRLLVASPHGAPGRSCSLLASDLAERDAKLVHVKLGAGFAAQRVRAFDLPQGLAGVAPVLSDTQARTLLTYAEEGGGILDADGATVLSFGRDVRLADAVADPFGRLWVKTPGERSVRYVDPLSGGSSRTLSIGSEAERLLSVFPAGRAPGFIVATYASTLGAAALIPVCDALGSVQEKRYFLGRALIGEDP